MRRWHDRARVKLHPHMLIDGWKSALKSTMLTKSARAKLRKHPLLFFKQTSATNLSYPTIFCKHFVLWADRWLLNAVQKWYRKIVLHHFNTYKLQPDFYWIKNKDNDLILFLKVGLSRFYCTWLTLEHSVICFYIAYRDICYWIQLTNRLDSDQMMTSYRLILRESVRLIFELFIYTYLFFIRRR